MKTPVMEEWLDSFTKHFFGHGRIESEETQTCVFCGGDANSFKDELSRKEYLISKLCQTCQDEVFGIKE